MKISRIAWICMSVVLLLPLSALAASSAPPIVVETPAAGLVSWWPGNGSASDFMGVSSGALNGAATYAAGHAGQAFSLAGAAGDYLSVPDADPFHTSQFSISAWFNWNGLGTTTTQFLIGKGIEHFEIELDSTASTNNVRFIPAGYPATFVDAANAIQPGWNHVVVTYSGAGAYVYVNGALAVSRTGIAGGADLTADVSPFTIGSRAGGAYPFKGLIDDVALYNRVLAATEVAALYSGGTLRSAAVVGGSGATATLYATVNDNGADTTASFEYGATTAYGSVATATPSPVIAGSGLTMVSGTMTGLAACGASYHYRIKAVNANGATYGADQTLGLRQCQTITFGASPVLVAGGGGTVTATSNSGLPVTLSTSTPAVCSVNGAAVTAKIAGTCTVVATQAGNGVYASASQTLNLTVGPGNQNISFGTAPVIGVGGTGTVSATSSSGLAVSFSSTTPGICTVSGATVTGVAAGTCAITASQAGDATIPAARASQSFTIIPIGGPIIGTRKPGGLVANGAPSTVTYNFNPRLSFPTRGTLNGLVNPNNDTCMVSFEYGPTTAYGSSVGYGTVSGAALVPVSSQANFTWIDDYFYNPELHYRTKAVCTASGTWYGNDITFVPFTSTVRWYTDLGGPGPANASYPTASIHILATCSDSATMANFDITNYNQYDVTIAYTNGAGYSGSVIIGSMQVQQIFVGKGSIASFSYNYTLFSQIITNDYLCSAPLYPPFGVRAYALGQANSFDTHVYALYNDNTAPVTLGVLVGSNVFNVTIPGRSGQLIATAKAEAQFSYNSVPFMILSPLGGFWADRYLVTAAPVSSTPSTSDFLLQNNDDAAHTVVLNAGGTEHRYTLPPYGSQVVTVEYGAWGLYLVVPGMTGPAMVGDHVKVGSLNPGLYSQSISFGAAPAIVVGGSGTVSATGGASGNAVTFSSQTPATCTTSGTNGATVTSVAAGACTITANQAGNASYLAAPQATQSFTIKNSTTTVVALTAGTNPSTYGTSLTFTATVSVIAPGSGTPTGTVTFKDGTTTLGTGTLTGPGQATFQTSALTTGSHSITAAYSGDANFTASTSTAVSQNVNQAATTTVISSAANPSTYGTSLTFTATVAAVAPGSGIPTGTVTFKDGTTTLGTGTLTGPGQATFQTSALTTGSHSITAAYSGDANFTASTSTAVNQTIIAATHVVIPTATGNGDIILDTNTPGCAFTSWGVKSAAQIANDALYTYPYGLVEFTMNCPAADVTITFPGSIAGTTYRKYGPTTPGNPATAAWYTFSNVTVNSSTSITLHLQDGRLGDDTGVDGIIVDQGGPGQPGGNGAVSVPTMTEWGMILFMLFAGAGAVYYLRRQGRA